MSEPSSAPVPQEPDILIQDLEDVPKAGVSEPDSETPAHRCARCEQPVPENVEYCDECLQTMRAYPIAPGAWIGAVLGILAGLLALFVLGVNLLIAHPIVEGDRALRADDLNACYTAYGESYSAAERLNSLLGENTKYTFFTNGAHTLEKQIIALEKLNGPYAAGRTIETYYGSNPPKALQAVYSEYQNISAFVTDMQQRVSDYRDKLDAGDSGNYDEMVSLVDAAQKKLPATPDYMAQYYRFSVSYSLADDPARTCRLLDELIAMQPDALWLYASEGIRAYDLGEQYKKALEICNSLMRKDASDPATIAYTVAQLRLLRQYDSALDVYDRALSLTEPSSEMQRQKAIVLMLQGKADEAEPLLVSSYSPSTATLEHVATIALCAHITGNQKVYQEYKTLLDSYVPFRQVDLFAADEITLEDIFLSGGGEVQ